MNAATRPAMRALLILLACLPGLALACKPSRWDKPPTVDALLASSAYVVHAEVLSVEDAGGINVAKIRVLEQFKGGPIDHLRSPSHSCGLWLKTGERAVFFLTAAREGQRLRYPYDLSPEQVLGELRARAR